MSSTFFGLEIGRRAVDAFRRAVEIVGHNVANVNTPGYHRQSPVLSATDPYDIPSLNKWMGSGQAGTGVTVLETARAFDTSLELQIRNLMATQQNYTITSQFLQQIDSLSSLRTGVNEKLSALFNAFQEVSDNPESITTRSVAVQAGVDLATEINQLASALVNARTDTDKYIQNDVTEVNNLIKQISDLNVLIRQVSSTGDNPNDLLDERDLALNKLSSYVNIQVANAPNNGVIVYLGGRAVVQDAEYLTLSTSAVNPANNNYVEVRFADAPLLTDPAVNITDGELKGLLNLRDSATSGLLYYKTQLDTLARSLTDPASLNSFNRQHALGFDLNGNPGGNFFDWNVAIAAEPALNMTINPALLNPLTGPALIAASSTAAGVPGNGLNALALARLGNTNIAALGNHTFSDFFTNIVSHLGANANDTEARKTATDDLMTQLSNLRDSSSAVSMDEEATYLTQYEKSYEAAARIISVYNDMLDEILNLVS